MDAVMGSIIDETKAREVCLGPPITPIRGIADQTASARAKQPSSHVEHDHRGSEATSGDHVGHRKTPGGDQGLDIGGEHVGTITSAQRLHAVPQEVGTLLASFDQRDVQVGPIERDHQGGKSAAGAEVDEMRGTSSQPGQRSDETSSVGNRVADRAAADRTATLDLGENSREEVVVSHSPGR